MITLLAILNEELLKLGIDYEYEVRTAENSYPYFIGTADITDNQSEYGGTGGTVILYGFDYDNGMYELLQADEKIKEHFENFISVKDGCAVSIEYNSCLPFTDQEDRKLKRINITMNWTSWKGK